MQGLVDRRLGVEREPGINLCRDLTGDNLQDLLAELNQQTVESGVDLLVQSVALVLTTSNGSIDQAGVFGLLGGGKDQGGVGGGVLRLVLANSCDLVSIICGNFFFSPSAENRKQHTSKVTRVADDYGAAGLELIKRRRHFDGYPRELEKNVRSGK